MAEGPVACLPEHTGGDSGPTGRWRGSCAFWDRTRPFRVNSDTWPRTESAGKRSNFGHPCRIGRL